MKWVKDKTQAVAGMYAAIYLLSLLLGTRHPALDYAFMTSLAMWGAALWFGREHA